MGQSAAEAQAVATQSPAGVQVSPTLQAASDAQPGPHWARLHPTIDRQTHVASIALQSASLVHCTSGGQQPHSSQPPGARHRKPSPPCIRPAQSLMDLHVPDPIPPSAPPVPVPVALAEAAPPVPVALEAPPVLAEAATGAPPLPAAPPVGAPPALAEVAMGAPPAPVALPPVETPVLVVPPEDPSATMTVWPQLAAAAKARRQARRKRTTGR